MIRKIWHKFSQGGEKGQALVLVLILLIVGALIIAPLMANIGTGLIAGEVHEEKANELYAADAGVEDGLWQIKKDKLTELFGDLFGSPPAPNGYYPYAYYDNNPAYQWNYDLTGAEQVNGMDVDITIGNVWIPNGMSAPALALAKSIIETGKLVVTGGAIAGSSPPTYKISISYYRQVTDPALKVEKIGVWLPPGFTYTGNCNLSANMTYSEAIIDHAGNKAVVWTFNPAAVFTSFPGVNPADRPMKTEITFRYSASQSGSMPDAVAWIDTDGVSDIPYAWDADLKVYQITSTVGNTTIDAYAIKSELRQLVSAIAGDYKAIGNSLMARSSTSIRYRDILLNESSTTVSDIPPGAEVELAYLYWSAWFKEGVMGQTIWEDKCSDINTQWIPGSRWTDSSGQSRGRGGSYTVADKTVTLKNSLDLSSYLGQTVIVTWEQREWESSGSLESSDNLSFAFSGDGGSTWSSDIIAFQDDIGSSFQEFTCTIPQAYLTDDFKMRFYLAFNSTDEYAYIDNIRIAQVILRDDCTSFATNSWTNGSQWTIYTSGNSIEFRGQGGGPTDNRTLTLTSSLDLSSYYGRTVKVSWEQDASWEVDSTDYLYFAFSKDGGTTWSSNIEAFHNDDPDSPFTYTIPQAYLTDAFKMKFYLAFNNSDEYAYLDDIVIAEYFLYDSTAIFKINGEQVYFDVNGDPAEGDQELTADSFQVIDNSDYGDPAGYSYACKKDVTDLILAFAEDDDGEPGDDGDESDDIYHPGNAAYTVGSVDATLGDASDEHREWAYAGWSLVIIYSSADTAGHQLYLYDTLLYKDHNDEFLDFDQDGQPGGAISGFLVPPRVQNPDGTWEVIAAKITCFVGEGDIWYEGDFLRFNGTKLPDDDDEEGLGGTNRDNVWNGQSIGMSAQGVDVDTFYVRWDDNLLSAGATSADIDIWTDIDIWNLVYIILSFRSATTTGGAVTYLIIQ